MIAEPERRAASGPHRDSSATTAAGAVTPLLEALAPNLAVRVELWDGTAVGPPARRWQGRELGIPLRRIAAFRRR